MRAHPTHVTKVLRINPVFRIAASCLVACAIAAAADTPAQKPAEQLYFQLAGVGLDATRVYQVRGASLTRSSIQISMDDGMIAFTQDVMGRITGAFFEGDGEILLTPPNAVERRSMSLFTGMAILEERFATAYFRFDDDAFQELRPDLRETASKQEFVNRWNTTAKNLASEDAMRLLIEFSQMLPSSSAAPVDANADKPDRFLHARLQGTRLGVFDVYFDGAATEQVQAGQAKTVPPGDTYYDVWASFPAPGASSSRTMIDGTPQPQNEKIRDRQVAVRRYAISTQVLPPKQIRARARMDCAARGNGERTLLFELSRFLQIDSVKLDGSPVEFIHNPALEGTQLARRGNDVVAVVLPEPLQRGKTFQLEFEYGGEVLAEAGNGLLYVGARGTWYPNRGMEMADYDLDFRYPQGWTLLATGKRVEGPVTPQSAAGGAGASAPNPGDPVSHWVSERPIPIAGFNLGKYREATTQAGKVSVEVFATPGVEKDFPTAPVQIVTPITPDPLNQRRGEIITPSRPSPVKQEATVGETAAHAIEYFSERFGAFPYSRLALTQMPGRESQGWPGMVFLSSYAFLNQEQRESLHYEPFRILLQELVPAHETAHQWWGDLVTWDTYRDQWFSEGLANYCALLMLQEKNPTAFRDVMNGYRRELMEKNSDGVAPMEAGPVTLGSRLLSSKFPGGYDAISYGRGAWLFHMLRTMMSDANRSGGKRSASATDEPFFRALRKIRQRYEGKTMSTREMLSVFAEEIPPALRYEGKNSLDWFLDSWINGTAIPKLELKGTKIVVKGNGQAVSGTILQKDAPDELVTSVPVYGVISGRPPVFLGRVFADGSETVFHLSAPAGVHKLVLDPYETILSAPK